MWLDKQNMFSEDQSLVGSASDIITSTNVLDVGDANKGEGNPLDVYFQLTTPVTMEITTTATSTLAAKLITSDAATLDSNTVTLHDTGAVAYTAWDAYTDGPYIRSLPNRAKRYLAWVFTLGAGADITAGAVTAALTLGDQSNS